MLYFILFFLPPHKSKLVLRPTINVKLVKSQFNVLCLYFLLCCAVSSPHLTCAVVCIPGEELLLSLPLSLPLLFPEKQSELTWLTCSTLEFVPSSLNYFSINEEKSILTTVKKRTHLPRFFFSSLLLFFPLLCLKFNFKRLFSIYFFTCHKMSHISLQKQ